jgi:hypothetical protein
LNAKTIKNPETLNYVLEESNNSAIIMKRETASFKFGTSGATKFQMMKIKQTIFLLKFIAITMPKLFCRLNFSAGCWHSLKQRKPDESKARASKYRRVVLKEGPEVYLEVLAFRAPP